MNLKSQSTLRSFVPFLVLTFFVCGVSGLFCPMAASATDTHHSHQTSHHTSSSQTSGECPDQLTSAAGAFENDDVSFGVLSLTNFTWLHDIPNSGVLQFFGNHKTPQSTSYPLLFLLFSVLLN
ncbi:MAG: hypothetical protein WD425_16010 [Nitrospirales bacterium]